MNGWGTSFGHPYGFGPGRSRLTSAVASGQSVGALPPGGLPTSGYRHQMQTLSPAAISMRPIPHPIPHPPTLPPAAPPPAQAVPPPAQPPSPAPADGSYIGASGYGIPGALSAPPAGYSQLPSYDQLSVPVPHDSQALAAMRQQAGFAPADDYTTQGDDPSGWASAYGPAGLQQIAHYAAVGYPVAGAAYADDGTIVKNPDGSTQLSPGMLAAIQGVLGGYTPATPYGTLTPTVPAAPSGQPY